MTKLKDLRPGDEFEYADTAYSYRQGKFLVLNTDGCYLQFAATDTGRFLFSYTVKKVVNHYIELEVNVIPKSEKTMENKMGHFIGWKFGVPIRIFNARGVQMNDFMYLINESEKYFETAGKFGGYEVLSKSNRSYELISYQQDGNGPVYPICQNKLNTAYFIESCKQFGGIVNSRIQPMPAATLTIDGKTIELSAETTAELKKELGI